MTMAKIIENHIHMVDMDFRSEGDALVDMTMCGIPAMECERLMTSADQFLKRALDETCAFCENELRRREFPELDNQE